MAFPTWCLAKLPVHGVWKTRSVGRALANSTWCIENGEHTFMVKQYAYDDSFGRSLGAAIAADIELANLGLAPKIVFSDNAHGVVISEWFTVPAVSEHFDPITRAEQLGVAQQTIHQFQPNLPTWSLWQRVLRYCDALTELNSAAGAQARSDCESYKSLFANWELGPRVFCHHDLNAEHVFLTPALKVIDWEYAGYGHPGFDVASTIVVNDLYDDEIVAFLATYNANNPHPIERESLPDWIRLIALINRIWFTLQEALTAKGVR